MAWDAVVIGAGCAGLAAATALSERGARVLVLEARPILGGRASAVRDAATGEKLDNGQHVLMGCYDETLALLARVGTADRVRRQSGLAVTMIDEGGWRSVLQLPPLPAPLHLLAGVLAWEALTWREKLSVLRVGAVVATRAAGSEDPALQPSGRDPLDRTRTERRDFSPGDGFSPGEQSRVGEARGTVRDWLLAHGQAPRLIQLFWEPLALAALNQPIDTAAMGTFLEVLSRMFGPEADRASLIIPAVPLDELYAEPARAWLEARGSEVRTRATARVVVEGSRVSGVAVRGEHIAADRVIVSAPWFALPQAFAAPVPALADLLANARETASSPIVTVNLWYDQPVLDEMLVGLPGRVFQWVFDKARVFGRAHSHLSLVSSGAAEVVSCTNDELIAIAAREVAAALPRAAAARTLRALAVRERHATFSLASGQPMRPATRTPIDGLLLAGDWVATGLPATIEGAVVSGHWAAAAAWSGH